MNEVEVWRPVVNFEDRYLISNTGRLKITSKVTKGILHPFKEPRISKINITSSSGYCTTVLIETSTSKRYTKQVHRLVAEAFIPNPENKPQVNHINGIKTDNRVENLEWCTASENVIHAYKTGLTKILSGEKHHASKLTNKLVVEIFRLNSEENKSSIEIGRLLSVSKYAIQRVLNKKTKGYHYPEYGTYHKRKGKVKKVTDDLIKKIKDDISKCISGKQISIKYKLSQSVISEIKNNKYNTPKSSRHGIRK